MTELNDGGWQKKKSVLRKFQIGWRRLEEWRLEGWVRSDKHGKSKSSSRLYYLEDINNVLLALSTGKKPVRVMW